MKFIITQNQYELLLEQKSDYAMDRQANAIAHSSGIRSDKDYKNVNQIINKTAYSNSGFGNMTIEQYRQIIESGPATFVLSLASFTPLKPIPMVLYGILVVDDLVKCFNGQCNWLSLILDLVSVILAPAISKSVKPIMKIVQTVMKSINAQKLTKNFKTLTYAIGWTANKLKQTPLFKQCFDAILKGLKIFKDGITTIIKEPSRIKTLPKFFQTLANWLRTNSSKVISTIDSWITEINNGVSLIQKEIQKMASKYTNKTTSRIIGKTVTKGTGEQIKQSIPDTYYTSNDLYGVPQQKKEPNSKGVPYANPKT